MASLKLLLAIEEATKRKAAMVKKHYQGPLVKFHTLNVNDSEHVSVVPGAQDNFSAKLWDILLCVSNGPLQGACASVVNAGGW
jgi:hypothetical protein